MSSVFLSYARGDDDDFVARTNEFLRSNGLTVWWDMSDMPSRSLTFTEEIRNAIHSIDRLVVVISPKALQSDYVRAEWQMALSEYKPVVPLLRRVPEGTNDPYSCLPPELRQLHAPNFVPRGEVEPPLFPLLKILKEPVPPPVRVIGNVPELPPHFRPRPDDFMHIFEAVLGELTSTSVLTDTNRVTVLRGMGGIGKTVLAASLVHSLRRRPSTFLADGIYWLDDSPLLRLAKLSGVPVAVLADESSMIAELKQRFLGRRFLLVIDNAISADQIAPLIRILGDSGRMLVTTRYGELATGHRSIHLDRLTEADSLRLIADWLGQSVDDLPPEVSRVAKLCGFHPFALSLNAASASQGLPWSAILAALENRELDFTRHQFDEYVYETVKHSIQISLDALHSSQWDADSRYRELAAFVWEFGVPASAIVRFWIKQSQLPQHHAERLLVFLQQRSLIELRGTLPECEVHLHDLHLAFLEQDRREVQRLNEALLSSYRPQDLNTWWNIPDDGYIHGHLVQHLDRARSTKEILALFTAENRSGGNAWYGIRMNGGRFEGYLADLQVASQSMHNCLFALMMSSLRSLARAVPAHLLIAAVQQGRWTIERAMAHARLNAQPAKRATDVFALLPMVKHRESWLDEGLSALDLAAVDDRESPVAQLVMVASEEEVIPILQRVTGWLREADSPYAKNKSVSVVNEVLGRIPAGLAHEALQIIEGTSLRPLRLYALLPEPERSQWIHQLLEEKRDFADPVNVASYAISVAGLAELLGPEAEAELLSESLTALRQLEPRSVFREEGLIDLLPHLGMAEQDSVLEELIADALNEQPRLFARLARRAPPLLHARLRESLETQDLAWIADAAPHFCSEHREALIEWVLSEIELRENATSLLWMDEAKLIGAMNERQLEKTTMLVNSRLTGETKVKALAAVARAIAPSNRDDAIRHLLTSIESLDDTDERAVAFHELAPLLSGHYLDDALSAAQRIGEPSGQEHLKKILPYLSNSEIRIVEKTKPDIFATNLPLDHARTHFDAEAVFTRLLSGWSDAVTATALAQLSKEQLLIVEERVRTAHVDTVWVPLETGGRIGLYQDSAKDYLRSRLAPSLARVGEIERAREYVRKADGRWKPTAWLGIAAATSGSDRVSALFDALRSVLELDAFMRGEHLDRLAHALTEPTLCEEAWRIAIDWARTKPRHEAIEVLAAFAPVAAMVGGVAMVSDLYLAVERVLRWWP